MDIQKSYDRILRRKYPDTERLIKAAALFESTESFLEKTVGEAMSPPPRSATDQLIEQGNRVEGQLQEYLGESYPLLSFRRQGSVTNDTHIKHYSDVDVLVIIGDFHTLQRPLVPKFKYTGDPFSDISKLRKACFECLKDAYKKATVDNSKSTAIGISGGSLRCDVDVVPSSAYVTTDYYKTNDVKHLGIFVYNKETGERTRNQPFLFNALLDDFDSKAYGAARRLIRLFKTLNADLEEDGESTDLSSYDICSLIYRIDFGGLLPRSTNSVDLARYGLKYFEWLIENDAVMKTLNSVDESRKIITNESKSLGVLTLGHKLKELLAG